ncbi:MAG: type II secretion system protein [Alphaproteobacteria bacterium]|nr:type II secretion system protein [Alphaproteobacteria bacterium]
MTNLKSQSGRSMVEMLGVLAIIGVLSIGGIAGYTMAMNRYRANEVLNIASQLAVLSQTMDQGKGGTATLATLGIDDETTVAGLKDNGSISATTNNGTTTVTISGLTNDQVASAIRSIAGGDDDCAEGTCNLAMTGSALKVGKKAEEPKGETGSGTE